MTTPYKQPRTTSAQRGMTLIELMVAMLLTSIVVFFLFSIQAKMSTAFKGQSSIADVNKVLRSARQHLAEEIRMAGFGLPVGTIGVNNATGGIDAGGTGVWPVLRVLNDADGIGPDAFHVIYAEPDLLTSVSALNAADATIASGAGFAIGDKVVLAADAGACSLELTDVQPLGVTFDVSTGSPYNTSTNSHCDPVRGAIGAGDLVRLYKIRIQRYRINPAAGEQSVLQRSPSGTVVANDWQDLGIGFTNLQVATHYFEDGDAVDADGDGDPRFDWYSGDNQAVGDLSRPANGQLIEMSLSIEVRSPFGARGTPSPATFAFVDLAAVDNNRVGDFGNACPSNPFLDPCGVDLLNTPNASRPDRYRGDHVYRASTTLIDLRNVGVSAGVGTP